VVDLEKDLTEDMKAMPEYLQDFGKLMKLVGSPSLDMDGMPRAVIRSSPTVHPGFFDAHVASFCNHPNFSDVHFVVGLPPPPSISLHLPPSLYLPPSPSISLAPLPSPLHSALCSPPSPLLSHSPQIQIQGGASVTLYAHKFVLVSASPVFLTMFTGSFKEGGVDEGLLRPNLGVVVLEEDPRVNLVAGQILLKYIYSGVVDPFEHNLHPYTSESVMV
jgi:hypothetical protein